MVELKRILLVDDDIRDIELALEALHEHHLANDVIVTRDGEEALDYLYRRGTHAARPAGNPIVILLDLRMPRVGGLEVLRTVKADPDLCTIPIVILTSSREESDLIRSYRLGANGYVVKPVDFAQFSQVVQEIGAFWAVLNEAPPQNLSAREKTAS